MQYALLLMNLQNDHAENGVAGVPESATIPAGIEHYIRDAGTNYRRKYVIRDWHPSFAEIANAGEPFLHFEQGVVHCMHDTIGANDVPEILSLLADNLLNGIYGKGQVYMDPGLSAFEAITRNDGYMLDNRLRYFGIDSVDIAGLSTPAIQATALQGVALGYTMRLLIDLMPPLPPEILSMAERYGIACVPSAVAWAGVTA